MLLFNTEFLTRKLFCDLFSQVKQVEKIHESTFSSITKILFLYFQKAKNPMSAIFVHLNVANYDSLH